MKLIISIFIIMGLNSFYLYSQSNAGYISWENSNQITIEWIDTAINKVDFKFEADSIIYLNNEKICLKMTLSKQDKEILSQEKLRWRDSTIAKFPFSKQTVGYSMNIVLICDSEGIIKYALKSGNKSKNSELKEFEFFFLEFLIGKQNPIKKEGLSFFYIRW